MIAALLLAATFYTAPIQPCEVCAHFGVVCTNQVERNHLIPQSQLKKLGLWEQLKDDPRLLSYTCDCSVHRCHLLVAHGGNYSNPHPEFIDMIRWIRKHKKPLKPMRQP